MATYAIWDKQSPEEFQPRLQYVLEGLGVKRIAATILIFGEGQTVEGKITNHDTNLREALQRAREKGLRFNAAKFVDRVQSVVFCGRLFSSTGFGPDADKTKAIVKMPPPCDRKAVQQFLGFENDMAWFIPQPANVDKAALLRQVLTKDAQFLWQSS